MKRKLIIGGIILVVLISARVIYFLWDAGQFKILEPHFAGTCTPVYGLMGAEDITIHPITGVAYISAYNRRATMTGRETESGIYTYDLKADNPKLVPLITKTSGEFRPHGISLFVGKNGQDKIFVINHAQEKHTIEIFDLVGGRSTFKQSIENSIIVSPNDLVAVGQDSFYVTNDHKHRGGKMGMLEDYLQLKWSNVIFCKGMDCSVAVSDFSYANGINVSHDQKTLYLSTTTQQTLFVYNRNRNTNKLTFKKEIDTGTGLDNIEIDSLGNIWIGAHPQILKFVTHAKDKNQLSPSQILRFSISPQNKVKREEIYLNLGDEISGSSVGAASANRLLIGSVFEPKILDCKL